jgi:predicted PurR-regulated permease PerM
MNEFEILSMIVAAVFILAVLASIAEQLGNISKNLRRIADKLEERK